VNPATVSPPRDLAMALLIARRAAIESLHDRLTLLMSLFFSVVLPVGLLVLVVRPLALASERETAGSLLTFYMLLVGLMPAVSAVGIASGQFAGEKERGILTPLLASPASNVAIFGGKVIGSVIPPLMYALIGEVVYVVGIALLVGPAWVSQLPLWLGLSLVALVPGVACFAAIVASLISSRVRTFNAAQQVAGIVLMPVWGVFLGLAIKLEDWGPAALFAATAALLVLDVLLTIAAATTWRREEVLSHT
jgi:ABC-type transport system involved in multi-copper enzyme maturation permease subunit